MRRRFLSVSGYVLAGGESRRMGKPKDQLELGGETMLARQVRRLASLTRSVAVLGPAERLADFDFEVVPDERPGLGPLGGIVTALARTRTEYNLVLGCDLPLVSGRFLEYLCAQALRSRADVTVPESPGHEVHPTCAVYRRRALAAARGGLERGDLSVRGFFPRVTCRLLRWPEVARQGFGAAIFANINTPEDYRAAQRRLGAST